MNGIYTRELEETVKRNSSIDWSVRENVQAKMRIAVKKILRNQGYHVLPSKDRL